MVVGIGSYLIGFGIFFIIVGAIMSICAAVWKYRSKTRVWTGGMIALLVIGLVVFFIGFILAVYGAYSYFSDLGNLESLVIEQELRPSVILPPIVIDNSNNGNNRSQMEAQIQALTAADLEEIYLKNQSPSYSGRNYRQNPAYIKKKLDFSRNYYQNQAINAIDSENLYFKNQNYSYQNQAINAIDSENLYFKNQNYSYQNQAMNAIDSENLYLLDQIKNSY